MDLDLKSLLRMVRRWWWILILFPLLGAGSAYLAADRQPDQYSARSQILMLSMPDTGSRYTGLLASQNLKPSYVMIAKSEPVMQAVIDELDLGMSVPELQSIVTVSDVANTQFLNVDVVSGDPQQAANIATSVSEQFVSYLESLGTQGLGVPAEVANTALVPTAPFEPRPERMAAIGAFIGLITAIGTIALLEYFRNAVTPDTPVEELTGAIVLSTVPMVGNLKEGANQVYTLARSNSAAAEAIRLLRTNLKFASASADVNKLVISSPNPGEGKSTTAANLGVVMAQGGAATVIIDADLRRPTQHKIFGVSEARGLTTLLTEPNDRWQDHANKVALPGLYLITSGPLPPNPSDLVSSARFRQLLERISAEVDFIIIDTPPVLSASDALSIGAVADGMLIVCQSGKTRVDTLQHTIRSAHRAEVRVVGTVLNRIKGQRGATYYGDYYYTAKTPETT